MILGQVKSIQHSKDGDAGQFIPYAESSYIGEPYFDYGDYEDGGLVGKNKETFKSNSGVVRSTIRNVTAQLGTTTYLHCRVNNLGGKTVSITMKVLRVCKTNFKYQCNIRRII